ncbi:MAG TPA: LytR C-terminal domain-containing protein [Patescibacteria group bacterium]
MKDFIDSVKAKRQTVRHSSNKSKTKYPTVKVNGLVLLITGLLTAGLIIRFFPWVDFFTNQPPMTILFVTQQVDQTGAYLSQFNFADLTIDVYPIPSDLLIEVLGGYGNYRFQAVYPLLVLEGKDEAFIRSTLSLSTGVLLDELWPVNVKQLRLESPNQFTSFLVQNFWHNQHISWFTKLAVLALALAQQTELIVQPSLSALPISTWRQANLADDGLSCTVALVNTTSLNGLAGRIDNLLKSQNFRVVRTTSDDTLVARTVVISGTDFSDTCQQVLTKITHLVPGGVERQSDDQQTQLYRADLVVKLGEDLVQ